MGLETAFRGVAAGMERIQEAFTLLRIAAVSDRPADADSALIDKLGDRTDDLLGCLEDALMAAIEGEQAVRRGPDTQQARKALARCHTCYQDVSRKFSSELFSYEQVAELTELVCRRSGEWSAWARVVRESLERCQEPLFEGQNALFHCWQEVAEHAEMSRVAVQANGVGQQFNLATGKMTHAGAAAAGRMQQRRRTH